VNGPHPYTIDEMHAGRALADAFMARVEAREPIGCDDLTQQMLIARNGSMERLRGFCSRLQDLLLAGVS
jgi:hypothetical protein